MPSDTVQRAIEPQPSEQPSTDLQQARSALQASNNRFSDLFEQAPMGYFIVDEEHCILQSNRFAASLRLIAALGGGWSAQELKRVDDSGNPSANPSKTVPTNSAD